jgi:adenylate kinase
MSTPVSGDQAAWIKGQDAACTSTEPRPKRTWHIILLGAPGIGKGTQAELLCRRTAACHLSTGDIFRAIRYDPHPLSPAMQKALEQMNTGALVADETVLDVIRERAGCLTCEYGFVLDGFPRTLMQAKTLDEMLDGLGVRLDAVLDFSLPVDQIIERLSGRRSCPQCRETYHVRNRPPRTDGRCDKCGSTLVQRSDDRPETIRVRMQAYNDSTAPLQEYYRRQGRLMTIPADGTPEQVHELVLQRLAVEV